MPVLRLAHLWEAGGMVMNSMLLLLAKLIMICVVLFVCIQGHWLWLAPAAVVYVVVAQAFNDEAARQRRIK
jgi:hypothetical protein